MRTGVPTFTECPDCGARVSKEKLRRHRSRVHGEGAARAKRAAPAEEPRSTVPFPWRTLATLAVIGVVVLAAYWVLSRPPEQPPSPPGHPRAVMETNFGTIRIELDTTRARVTAGNFISLARSGFYDGLTFHRVAANFVIQGGDPNGDGTGGSGTNVAWENTGLLNARYTIAMARSGDPDSAASKDTATSQFFINLNDNTGLDSFAYPFVVFGRVIEGRAVVDAIGALYPAGQTSYDGPPTQTVRITRVTIVG